MVPRARILPVDFTALGLELMADQMTSYKSIVVFSGSGGEMQSSSHSGYGR